MRYYASAEEMAASLDLPLLLRTDVDLRFLERHDRLSGYAAERPHAGRLYHRVIAALGTTGLADRVLWVAGPWGSLEHLPWAIGLAGAMADAGLKAYLHAERIDLPHSGSGAAGEHLGGALGARAASLAGGPLASFATDLQGVRVLVAGEGAHSGTISASGLVLADTLPEELEAPSRLPDGIDGVVLVAGFRDHGVYELESCARQLRSAGHRILGLVAMGPEAGKVLEAPESRLGPGRESIGRALIGLNSPSAAAEGDQMPAAMVPSPPERPLEPPTPKVDPPKEPAAPTEDSSLSRARAMESNRSADAKRHSTGKAKREASPKSEASPSFAAVRPKAPSDPAPIAPEREAREAVEPKVAPLLQPSSPKSEEPPSYTRLPAAPGASSKMAAMPEPEPEPKREPEPEPSLAPKPEPKPAPVAAPAPKPERAPAQAASPVPAPSSAVAAPPPAKPSSPGGSAVPLLSRWEAEAKRDRRMNTIGATVGVLVLLLLAAGMGLVYGKRKGWIPSRQPTTASATEPAASAPPQSAVEPGGPTNAALDRNGMSSSPPSDTIEDAPALGTTPAEPPTERRAAGLEEESEPGRDANGGTPDPKPTRDFPWGTPKRAFASSDSVGAVKVSAGADSVAARLLAPAGVALPDSASGPDASDFVVHLSSFKLEREAAAEVANLAALGVDARYLLVDVPGKGPWYRVVTGRFATFAEAEARAMRLCRSKGVPRTHVAGLGGRGAPVPVDSLAGVPAESRPRMD